MSAYTIRSSVIEGLKLLAFLGVGASLGLAALVVSPLKVLAALAALLLVPLVLRRPELLLLGILVCTSTVIAEENLPRIWKFYISDLLLLALLGYCAVQWLLDRDFHFVKSPLNWPVFAFVAIAGLATVAAIVKGTLTPKTAIDEARYVSYFLLFFVVLNLLRQRQQLAWLLKGIVVLALLVAIAMIVQYLLGDSVKILAGRVETLRTDGKNYEGITRILPPGEPLLLITFMLITALLVFEKFRAGHLFYSALWGMLLVGLILTFRRSVWVTVGMQIFILALLLNGRQRLKLFGWGLAMAAGAAMLLIPALESNSPRANKLTSAFVERLSTLADSKIIADQRTSTLRWRDFEYEYAIPQILVNPLLGLGMGAEYRPYVPGYDHPEFDGRKFVHNGHVYIMVKTGLLGYLALAWFSVAFLVRSFFNWRYLTSPFFRAAMLGIGLTFLGAFISAISEPRFMEWAWAAAFGVMLGLNEALIHVARQPIDRAPVTGAGIRSEAMAG